MSFVKNGILLAIGGLLGAFFSAALLDDGTIKAAKDGCKEMAEMDRVIEKLRLEGQAALAECKTDEEREAVYEKIRTSVEDLKAQLQAKCDALIEEFRQKGEAPAKEVVQPMQAEEDHVKNIKDALERFSASLDETLESLKPQPPTAEA